MSAIYGIRVRLGQDCQVFAGIYLHHYGFTSEANARQFIRENWTQQSASWKRTTLSVAPLPPHITVRRGYLLFEEVA